jgi:hypothetical protein
LPRAAMVPSDDRTAFTETPARRVSGRTRAGQPLHDARR